MSNQSENQKIVATARRKSMAHRGRLLDDEAPSVVCPHQPTRFQLLSTIDPFENRLLDRSP